jgi:hypothetical protein
MTNVAEGYDLAMAPQGERGEKAEQLLRHGRAGNDQGQGQVSKYPRLPYLFWEPGHSEAAPCRPSLTRLDSATQDIAEEPLPCPGGRGGE